MVSDQSLQLLNIAHPDLKALLKEYGEEKIIPKGTELLREGQYVKVIPFVVEGAVKVLSRYSGKELLLYYIQPQESCVMSFTSALQQRASQIVAITDVDSRLVLLPTTNLQAWMSQYPSLSTLFFNQYSMRYQELISSLNHILFDTLDKKVLQYLTNRIKISGQVELSLTHREIAQDLATSREVITRILKKLEINGLITSSSNGIKLKKQADA